MTKKLEINLEFEIDLEVGNIQEFIDKYLLSKVEELNNIHPQIKLIGLSGQIK